MLHSNYKKERCSKQWNINNSLYFLFSKIFLLNKRNGVPNNRTNELGCWENGECTSINKIQLFSKNKGIKEMIIRGDKHTKFSI